MFISNDGKQNYAYLKLLVESLGTAGLYNGLKSQQMRENIVKTLVTNNVYGPLIPPPYFRDTLIFK